MTEYPEGLHYGDPFKEQELYEAGIGIHPIHGYGVVTVSGPDRLSWLTTLSTQVVETDTELLLLDANGRIEHAAGVVDDGETAWLLTTGDPASLAGFLESMKFMLQVEVADRTGEFDAYSTVAESAVTPGATIVWNDPWPGEGARYFQGTHPGADLNRRVYLVPVGEEFAPNRPRVGELAAEATRIAAWRPLMRSDVDSRAMPAELDWIRSAVDLEKGCYKGQESIARIVNLGKPPRRFTFLQLDGSTESIPAPGDAIELDGRQVGIITSPARHYEMGPIALGLLKRNLDPAAALRTGDIAIAQELIVPVEGRSDHSPKERPGAGLRVLRRPE